MLVAEVAKVEIARVEEQVSALFNEKANLINRSVYKKFGKEIKADSIVAIGPILGDAKFEFRIHFKDKTYTFLMFQEMGHPDTYNDLSWLFNLGKARFEAFIEKTWYEICQA